MGSRVWVVSCYLSRVFTFSPCFFHKAKSSQWFMRTIKSACVWVRAFLFIFFRTNSNLKAFNQVANEIQNKKDGIQVLWYDVIKWLNQPNEWAVNEAGISFLFDSFSIISNTDAFVNEKWDPHRASMDTNSSIRHNIRFTLHPIEQTSHWSHFHFI